MCTESGGAAAGSVCVCCTKKVWPLRKRESGSTPSVMRPSPPLVAEKRRGMVCPSLRYGSGRESFVIMLKAAWSRMRVSLALAIVSRHRSVNSITSGRERM